MEKKQNSWRERESSASRDKDGRQRESIGDGVCIWQETEFRGVVFVLKLMMVPSLHK